MDTSNLGEDIPMLPVIPAMDKGSKWNNRPCQDCPLITLPPISETMLTVLPDKHEYVSMPKLNET